MEELSLTEGEFITKILVDETKDFYCGKIVIFTNKENILTVKGSD